MISAKALNSSIPVLLHLVLLLLPACPPPQIHLGHPPPPRRRGQRFISSSSYLTTSLFALSPRAAQPFLASPSSPASSTPSVPPPQPGGRSHSSPRAAPSASPSAEARHLDSFSCLQSLLTPVFTPLLALEVEICPDLHFVSILFGNYLALALLRSFVLV